MEDRDYMLAALELAKEAAAEGEVPVGCVITRNELAAFFAAMLTDA